MEFNCITTLLKDKKTPYTEAPHRNVITDGLSEEAIYYVNQAVARTQENTYSVFDEYGLMPDNYDYFNDLLESRTLLVCDYGENGSIYTADERFAIEHQDDGATIVYYDSDGTNGYDRTATYESTPLGKLKTKETFNADGDDINEVEITRDIITRTLTYGRISKEKNPNYGYFDYLLNFIGLGESEYIDYYYEEDVTELKKTTTEIGVNADDLGYDKLGGNHFEYSEEIELRPKYGTKVKNQAYYKWRYADEYEHDYYSK